MNDVRADAIVAAVYGRSEPIIAAVPVYGLRGGVALKVSSCDWRTNVASLGGDGSSWREEEEEAAGAVDIESGCIVV